MHYFILSDSTFEYSRFFVTYISSMDTANPLLALIVINLKNYPVGAVTIRIWPRDKYMIYEGCAPTSFIGQRIVILKLTWAIKDNIDMKNVRHSKDIMRTIILSLMSNLKLKIESTWKINVRGFQFVPTVMYLSLTNVNLSFICDGWIQDNGRLNQPARRWRVRTRQ